MIKVVIFDFDGVLVESVDIKTAAFAALFEAEGTDAVRRVVDYHRRHTGVSRYEKFRYIYAHILKKDLTEEVFEALCEKFAVIVKDEVVRAAWVAGAKEFLETYAARYRCFISSATPHAEIEEIVLRRGMGRYFERVYGAPKKKRDIVGEVLAATSAAPHEAVYVGDAMSDYEAAAFHHIHFIARTRARDEIFDAISCVKILDLVGLEAVVAAQGACKVGERWTR